MPPTALIDTNVFVHALGRDENLREACVAVLSAVADQRLDAVISVETVQELFHVRWRKTGDRAEALGLAREINNAYRTIAVVDTDVSDALDLADRCSGLGARDAFILASSINAGVDTVISTDRGFAGIDSITLIDPADSDALARLLD